MTNQDEKKWGKEVNEELERLGFERFAPPVIVTNPVYVTIHKRVLWKFIHYTHIETSVLGQHISYGPDHGIECVNGNYSTLSIYAGDTRRSQDELTIFLIEKHEEYSRRSYNMLLKNCHHFALELVNFLEPTSPQAAKKYLKNLVKNDMVDTVVSFCLVKRQEIINFQFASLFPTDIKGIVQFLVLVWTLMAKDGESYFLND